MARKKASSKKRGARKKRAGKSLVASKDRMPANWRETLRGKASEQSERVPAGAGNRINLKRNNTFQYQEANLGESIDCVIVDHVFMNTYYDSDYDENNPTPPTCFALKPERRDMAPHDNSAEKQSEICAECWANEWASGRDRGKACGNKVRAALLHAEDLEGDMATMDVPVTSVGTFNKFIKRINEVVGLPSFAALVRVSMDPDADWQTLEFEFVEELPDGASFAISERLKEAREMLMKPFDKQEAGSGKKRAAKKKKKASKKKASKKRGARRKKKSRFT